MSTDPWDQEDDEPRTRFYTPAQVVTETPELLETPESTRAISPTEHARLMAGTRTPTAAPVLVPAALPAARPTRPPMPPPLPSMRAPASAPHATETATASDPEAPGERPRTLPAVHSARATAALVESLARLQAAQGDLRQSGLSSPDLAVAEQLVLGVLEGVHRHGWAP